MQSAFHPLPTKILVLFGECPISVMLPVSHLVMMTAILDPPSHSVPKSHISQGPVHPISSTHLLSFSLPPPPLYHPSLSCQYVLTRK